jgi:hypothetical protein
MRTDETFVKANFCDAFISELKRVKKGFVDIPVGDFKVSHLSNIPVLIFMALLEFIFHKWMDKTYVFLSHWLRLFIRLLSKRRRSVLMRTELQTCRVVLLTPLARLFASRKPCFQLG